MLSLSIGQTTVPSDIAKSLLGHFQFCNTSFISKLAWYCTERISVVKTLGWYCPVQPSCLVNEILCLFTYLWVSFNLKMVVTEMTLHPKSIDRSCVVITNFLLFCIVAYTYERNVSIFRISILVCAATVNGLMTEKWNQKRCKRDLQILIGCHAVWWNEMVMMIFFLSVKTHCLLKGTMYINYIQS